MLKTVERSATALVNAPAALIRGVTDIFARRSPPVGSRPGTLAIDKEAAPTRVFVLWCEADTVKEREIENLDDLAPILKSSRLAWLDVRGLATEATLRALAARFDIHPLALEDIVHVGQRPKVDRYGKQMLVFVRMLSLHGHRLEVEQLTVLVAPGLVITFQESEGDPLEPVRARLREGSGPIRDGGSGYLAYAIIDTVIDAYFPLLERLAEMLEDLEEEVLERPTTGALQRVQATKRTLMLMRRSVWPTREAVNGLIRDPSELLDDNARLFLRDTYDHCVHVADVTESYRELVSELTNTYLSVVSNRMNQIMKVLTVIASIFIPLTFLAGIYGMNFDNMPELHTRQGYFILLGVMIVLGLGMLLTFLRMGWLSSGESPDDSADRN